MALSDDDRVIYGHIKNMAADFSRLDGSDGTGGGILKRTKISWRISSTFIFRAYILSAWIENRPPLSQNVTPTLLESYEKLIVSANNYIEKMPVFTKNLSSDMESGITSWYDDEDVWECGIWTAIFGVGVLTTAETLSPEAFGATLAAGATAIDKCAEAGEKDPGTPQKQ